MSDQIATRLHGTCVTWQGQGVLILGASGSGKSSLALHLMALGCALVADDQVEIEARNGTLVATCPEAIRNRIEARGFGLLEAQAAGETDLICAVNLEVPEAERLPQEHSMQICGIELRLFHNPVTGALPFALVQHLKGAGNTRLNARTPQSNESKEE